MCMEIGECIVCHGTGQEPKNSLSIESYVGIGAAFGFLIGFAGCIDGSMPEISHPFSFAFYGAIAGGAIGYFIRKGSEPNKPFS